MLILKFCFTPLGTNIDTLKHLVLKEFDGYHNYLVNVDCKDGLS
jgi:hypothetical protein